MIETWGWSLGSAQALLPAVVLMIIAALISAIAKPKYLFIFETPEKAGANSKVHARFSVEFGRVGFLILRAENKLNFSQNGFLEKETWPVRILPWWQITPKERATSGAIRDRCPLLLRQAEPRASRVDRAALLS